MLHPIRVHSRSSAAFSLFLVVATCTVFAHAAPPEPVNSPLSPAESLQHFQLPPGLKIELVASEPQLRDPVSIAFDEDGRLWVAEMIDYPLGPKPSEEPQSRIMLLEDTDNDGFFETGHLFADKLLFANGVQPWKGGVIVTMAGEVAYMKDTDGDHKADLRETWFTGFTQQNSQLRANHPRFGLDNWVYVANGLRGGVVVANKEKWGKEYPPVDISGKDFRFNPHTGECEAISGNGQFGMTFDDWGNRFICSNRNPCRHVVLEDRYLKRNPFLAVRDIAHDVSPPAEKSRVYPLTRAWTTSTLHAGQFTAACGVTIYRGDALPSEFYGNSFTCEPTGNLVHRDILRPSGATFDSKYAYDDRDFLASPDEWFRAVDLANGPDGALYVVDMYRAVIEHPDFVPTELKNRPDQRFGDDRGRIYRIRTDESRPALRSRPKRLSELKSAPLVQFLGDPNAWHRDTAMRLINERREMSVSAELSAMVSKPHPVAPVCALNALAGRNGINPQLLLEILPTRNLRLREQAIRLSEPFLQDSAELRAALLALRSSRVNEAGSFQSDVLNDSRCDFQLALTLGEMPAEADVPARLAGIAIERVRDEWTRRAVFSSCRDSAFELFGEIVTNEAWFRGYDVVATPQLIRESAELVGSALKQDQVSRAAAALIALGEIEQPKLRARVNMVQLAGFLGLGQGIARRGGTFAAIVDKIEATERGAKEEIRKVFETAARLAANSETDRALRDEAIGVLAFAEYATVGETLISMIKSDAPQEIRLRAIDVLSGFREPGIGPALLEDFTAQTPAMKRAVLQALLRDSGRTKQLLAAIADKQVAVTELDPTHVRALTNHRDSAIREEAKQLLAAAIPADRKQVLEAYQPALSLKADAKRGRIVFEKNCTQCHKIGDLGVDVAPDIADSRTKTPAQLFNDILNPNGAIDNNYVSYTVLMKDGKTHTGIISADTASSITLRQPENKTLLLLRQDIEELKSNGVSLMPEGLEKNITVEQMADLISFIKNWRYLDGATPVGDAADSQP
jgi:putative membrane-bound dehydrogenase-like protein